MVTRCSMVSRSAFAVAAFGLALAGMPAYAQQAGTAQDAAPAQATTAGDPPTEAPAITPSVDVDVEYELASLRGMSAPASVCAGRLRPCASGWTRINPPCS